MNSSLVSIAPTDFHPDPALNLEKVEILLVDDRVENLLALETTLASEQYRLVRAGSGDEALRYLLEHEPALILMDVQMPGMDGFETVSIIKGSERTRSIPIVFITALNQDDRYVLKGYQHGAIDYIYKPFDPVVLRSKVAVFAELAQKTKSLLDAERKLREGERRDRERQIAHLELKSLKREQLEQKKYLELASGITHGIVWSIDAESHCVTFVSPSSEKILGYTVDDWSSSKDFLINCILPSDRVAFQAAMDQIKFNSGSTKIEHQMIKRDGTQIWYQTEMKSSLKTDLTGHEIRGLSIDITELKISQAELAKSKERSDFIAEAGLILSRSFDYLANIKEIANLAVRLFTDGFVFYQKHASGKLDCLEASFSSLKKWNFHELELSKLGIQGKVSPENPLLWEMIPETSVLNEYLIKSAMFTELKIDEDHDYLMVWLESNHSARFNDADLAMAKALAMRTGITIQNALLNHRAETAIKVRDDFLSVASHELKTPLTPLKLQTQLLARMLRSSDPNEPKNQKIEKVLATFDRQLNRLSTLIDELLDISRISGGKLTIKPENFDLVELIQTILGHFSEQLASAQCLVKIEAPKKLEVCWDAFRIEQVFINLLTNAAKYGAQKPIFIQVKSEGQQVKISVTDQGIGIAEDDLTRIFKRFERAVSGDLFSGLGLGLYIVTQILEAHQGSIQVKSMPGIGSTFTVSIPSTCS